MYLSQQYRDFIILDIGGTLSKICVVSSKPAAFPCQDKLTIDLPGKHFYFHFFKQVQQCWEYLLAHFSSEDGFQEILITGGGAYKYDSELKEIAGKMNKKVVVIQQFQSLLGGLTFFKAHLEIEEFIVSSFSIDTKQTSRTQTSYKSLLDNPILVVNIGSGISILLVKTNENGQLTAERVGGTSLGGGFFMGLANLLVGENNFQKLLKLAEKGDVKNTDFIPEDFPEVNGELSEASVLVSLAKLKPGTSQEDIVRSLFYMVTFNIAQIALETSDIYQVNNVLFTGFYCRQNQFFLECFAEAFNFFRKGSKDKSVYSMRHDGFLGTLGAAQTQLYGSTT